MYLHDRNFYIDLIINEQKKNYKQTPDREDMINDLIEKIKKEEEEKKTPLAIIKETYKAKGGSLPKCDRVTIVSEAEHVGEKLPFYNTAKVDGEDDEGESKKKKKRKNLFYPKVNLLNF